jgi:hypothetical protein
MTNNQPSLWSQIHLQKPETKLVVKVFNPPPKVFAENEKPKQNQKPKKEKKFSFENEKILKPKISKLEEIFLHHKLVPTKMQFHTYSFGNNGPPTSFERVSSFLKRSKDIHLRDILMKLISKESGVTCRGISTFGKFNEKHELDYNSPVYYLGFFSHESCWASMDSVQLWRLGCHKPKFSIFSDIEDDIFNNQSTEDQGYRKKSTFRTKFIYWSTRLKRILLVHLIF